MTTPIESPQLAAPPELEATPSLPPPLDGPARWGFRGALEIVAARLRLIVVFAIVFAVIGGWETIRTYWGRLTSPPASESAVSSDTEFFCPMDPGVLSDWPSKCPVCNMTLVRRKRGEAVPLPDGVVARMQFTPYRLWLGGIRTEPVGYEPLSRIIELPGIVRDAGPGAMTTIEAEVFARELGWLEEGQAVEVVPAAPVGNALATGKVGALPRTIESGGIGKLTVAVDGPARALRSGERIRVRVVSPVDRLEPFRSQPTSPPPLAPGEPRRLFACMDHADVVREAPGRCPRDGLELMARPLLGNQRVRWWCPMHPAVTAERSGAKCEVCGGMPLVPRVVSYRPPGRVLAIPCSAAIDDGAQCLVYVERGAGMFDAKAVTLGPRCGALFPVVSGLEPGDRVAGQGAFLIDAETRLNPGLVAAYFGAGAGPAAKPATLAPRSPAETNPAWLEGLPEVDRPAALRQKTCPVTGKALGSMGVPPRITVRGRALFLCCDGCASAVQSSPDKYLAKVPGGAAAKESSP